MAIMIPCRPLDYDPASREDMVFEQLQKYLPDDVYVCHSLSIFFVDEKKRHHNAEIDFLVIVPNEGVLLIESKAGQIYPECKSGLIYKGEETDYLWHLSNGDVMPYNGPFKQVERARGELYNYLTMSEVKSLGYGDRITFSQCVCLPTISKSSVDAWQLPPSAGSRELIISRDDLGPHLYEKILDVINVYKTKHNYHALDKKGCEDFINYVLAPKCNLLPSKNFWIDYQNNKLQSFLDDQIKVLDFLEEQKIAIIGGAAGTGKTLVAIEKARRLAQLGHKVLFLCYNSKLKEHLEKTYAHSNISYENIDSLALKYTGKYQHADYLLLKNKISAAFDEGEFPYDSILVDEAQDYGKPEIETSGLLKLFVDIAELQDGYCYLFYDKYQLVQSHQVPSVISNADCKITLFRNCRNTRKIAEASYKIFSENERSKKNVLGFQEGNTPCGVICDCENNFCNLTLLVKEFRERGCKDIVILTAKTIEKSTILEYMKGDKIYFDGFPCKVATCRTFKGLEAEAVILIDVDATVLLDDEKRLLFYVGASRAKFDLGIIFNLNKEECEAITNKYNKDIPAHIPNALLLTFALKALTK